MFLYSGLRARCAKIVDKVEMKNGSGDQPHVSTDTRMTTEVSAVEQSAWEEARRFLAVIQPLAQDPRRTRADVIAASKTLGCSRSHLYVMLGRYLTDPRLTSLVPRRRGPGLGHSRLSGDMDALIEDAIETVYLTPQRPKIKTLVTEVKRRCHFLGLPAPGRKAITARLRARPRITVIARREGGRKARERYAPVIGSFEADFPLSLVQIDHTLVDVIVVDSATRTPIQRPWLTLAIDVYSRCVAGFYLSLEPPSATSVAMCILHAALPKAPWLAARKIDETWPIQGIMKRLHLDNAKEFRSEALRRGCEQYGIEIDYRPVRTPHYGGHIERLIGTMMGQVHLLPGTTFSDVRAKGNLDPEKTAAMTIDEVERWLVHAIAGVYHRDNHGSLNVPPVVAWQRGIAGDGKTAGVSEPVAVTDPRRFLIDFLPIERRKVRREGVSLHLIYYWSDVLASWIGEREKMIVRYDPRDLSRVYLLAPDGQYYDLSYRDVGQPPISLWEHRLARKQLLAEGRKHIDAAAIFRAIDQMRSIADEAINATKVQRRQRERRQRSSIGDQAHSKPAPSPPPVVAAVATATTDGEKKLQPWQRMLKVEEWT
jgi:putative transposase